MKRFDLGQISKKIKEMLEIMTGKERDRIPGVESDVTFDENFTEFIEPQDEEAYLEAGQDEPVQTKKRRRRINTDADHGSLIRSYDGLLAAFLAPMFFMVIVYASRGIFPFGEESFLRTDMYHQYAPFFSEFQNKLLHGGSLLYSWDVGLGVNFSALYAYYLASPVNWLLILCPKSFIIEFMTYLIVLKIGLSGLSFAWYLKKHNRTNDFGIAFFGIFYALSGYMAAYNWNIMWLDCIALFPLIMLGLERLVKDKKGLLYGITLGLSILSNYYISIMICIFMVFYLAARLILEGKKRFGEYLAVVVRFALYSAAAGGAAAVVLLPAVYALKMTASGNFSFPKTFSSYFSVFDMIARHIGNVQTENGLDHWPNIYCGVAVLMFFLLYLGCRRISRKEKVIYCGLLLFFFASFSVNVLNFIWHGFHYPNSLPARQSFIYIFLILSMCYQAYVHLREIPWKHVALSFWGACGFVLLAEKLVTEEHFHFSVFYVAILFLAVYAGLVYLWQSGRSRNLLVLLTLAVVGIEATVNTAVTSVPTTNRTNYVKDNKEVRRLLSSLDDSGPFYRVEKVDRKTKNDGAWMNFPSVSLFSSTANADLTKFLRTLGCETSTNAYSITGSTPLVDALLSVKYGLYTGEPVNTGLLTYRNEDGGTFLYENDYTLPLGFLLPHNVERDWNRGIGNPADVQNDLAALLGAGAVLERAPGNTSGTKFSFTPEVEGDYYIYVENKKIEKVTLSVGERTKTFDNVSRGYFLETKFLQAGEEVTLESTEGEQDLIATAYRFLPEGLRGVCEELNREALNLKMVKDARIEGDIYTEEGGSLFLSIPYDKGWTAYLDGQKVITGKLYDTFLSFHVPPGSHKIVIKYIPEGLKTGALITAGSVTLMALLGFYERKRPAKRREDTEAEENEEVLE